MGQSGRTRKVACTFSRGPGNPNHTPRGALGPIDRYRGVRAQHFFQLARSERIEQLVQEAKTEDQEAVVTELRAHEQGLLGATPAAAR